MMKLIRIILLLMSLLATLTSWPQVKLETEFLNHLSKKNLRIEHLQYIKSLSIANDSIEYLLALYYLQYDDEANFSLHFKRSSNIFLHDTLAVGYASCFYLQHDSLHKQRRDWFNSFHIDSLHGPLLNLMSIASINTLKPGKMQLENYPNVLRSDVASFRKIATKRPVISAFLSTLLPGMGKIYIGKFRIGLNTLLINGLMMAQSYESVHRLGWKHPLSIFNILLSSFFYFSNIYGSYRDTNYFRNEQLEQLNINVSNYYSVNHYSSLQLR